MNGVKTAIPSYIIRHSDVIGIRELSRQKPVFGELAVRLKNYNPPSWLTLERDRAEGKVTGEPSIEEANIPANMQKIIEFYSR